MSPQEFKQLNYQLYSRLKAEFHPKKQEVKILQDFNGQMVIGIQECDGSDIYECYQVNNNGNEASWQFIGHSRV